MSASALLRALLCFSPWLFFNLTPRSSAPTRNHVLGLVNVTPISRPTAPWTVRRHGKTTLFDVPEAAQAAAATNSSPKAAAAPPQNSAQAPPQKGTINYQNSPLREGVWAPPSQNVAQRRHGRIFSIEEPQDLLDFVIEDERLSVVKVYASWCKTCQVFDVRYRKLASKFGDKYDAKNGTEITQRGPVRFAEMRFDNPNNEEMCKLLNATKLPYIFMYKGSKGKVDEFQCGPAKFQMLIDAVNEHADPAVDEDVIDEDGEEINRDLDLPPVLNEDDLAASPPGGDTTMAAQTVSSDGEDTVDGLKKEVATLQNEKLEMFEIMKAQIEHDKVYIKKLENGVETQRSIIEVKDGEIFNMTTNVEQQQSMLQSKEDEMKTLSNNLDCQRKETRQARSELSIYKSQVAQLTNRISKIEKTVKSVELVSSLHEKSAQENELDLVQQIEELEEEKKIYEQERNSLRKLSMLAVKRVGRGVRSLVSKARRKKVN